MCEIVFQEMWCSAVTQKFWYIKQGITWSGFIAFYLLEKAEGKMHKVDMEVLSLEHQ